MALVETVKPLAAELARISPNAGETQTQAKRANSAVDMDRVFANATPAKPDNWARLHRDARRRRRATRRANAV